MPGQEVSKLRANRERLQRMKQLKQKGRQARCLSLESLFPPSEFQVWLFPLLDLCRTFIRYFSPCISYSQIICIASTEDEY